MRIVAIRATAHKFHVPDFHVFVIGRRGNALTVRGPGYVIYSLCMRFNSTQDLASIRIPEFDELVGSLLRWKFKALRNQRKTYRTRQEWNRPG